MTPDTAAATTQTAGQVVLPKTAADVTTPATGIVMHPEYAKAIGRFAYIWGCPMVDMLNRSAAITKAPQPGRLNGVLPVAPRGQVGMLAGYIDPGQTFVTCPNQDVVYGLVFFSLDEEPVVAQVPNFSMTLYNEEHFFHPTSQKRYSLGTKNKNLQKAPTVR